MSTTTANTSIALVVIDDDNDHRALIEHTAHAVFDRAHRVIEIFSYADADEALAEMPIRDNLVVLIDNVLRGAQGIDWISDFVRHGSGPVILMTSSGDEQTAAEAFRRGAFDYIMKCDMFENPSGLLRTIDESLRRYKLTKTNRELSRRLKVANNDLEIQNDRLVDLTSTAEQFVDDVAHEFRTPLAVIREFASIMNDGIGGEVNEKQHQYLDFIVDATRDLALLIDDFLDSSKIRSRSLRVDRVRGDPKVMFDPVWTVLENRASTKNIRIEHRFGENIPEVYCDIDKARRSLINLAVNAIKFSPLDGRVVIQLDRTAEGDLDVQVIDEGPGLPPEGVAALFGRFNQTETGKVCEVKGFGLGLSIVRELVAINLGEIQVSSQLGEGSTFSFSLPANKPEAIIRAAVAHARAESQQPFLSICRVSCAGLHRDVDQIQSIIAGVCRPFDLLFADRKDGSVLLIGETSQPERWRDRLLQVKLDSNDSAEAGAVERLSVDVVGRWPADYAAGPIVSLLSDIE